MTGIRGIAQQALKTGYLTVEAENQLRKLLSKKYDLEDLKAFMTLQREVMDGRVKQASREVLYSHRDSCGLLRDDVALIS